MALVFVDDLQMRKQVRGQDRSSVARQGYCQGLRRQADSHGPRVVHMLLRPHQQLQQRACVQGNSTRQVHRLVATDNPTSIVKEPRARALGCPSVCQQKHYGVRVLEQQSILRKLGQCRAEC